MSSMRSGALSRTQCEPRTVQSFSRKGVSGKDPRCIPLCSSISDSTCRA